MSSSGSRRPGQLERKCGSARLHRSHLPKLRRRIPIFRGRLRAPLSRTSHLGLPPRPLLPERALARRLSALLGDLAPRLAGPATKIGTPSRCGRDAERAELGAWVTTNRYQVIGSGLGHRRPSLNLSRASGAGCSRSIAVVPMGWPLPSTQWTAGPLDRSSANTGRGTDSGRPARRSARVGQ